MDQYSNYGGQQEPPSNYEYQQYNDPYGQGGYVAPTNPSSEYYYGGLGGSGANASGGTNYGQDLTSDNSSLSSVPPPPFGSVVQQSSLSPPPPKMQSSYRNHNESDYKDVTEANLAEHFGGIGMLKIDKRTQKPKIWIYYDKINGLPKGDAAIRYFNNQPFLDQVIKVEMSVRKISAAGFNNGDWACDSGGNYDQGYGRQGKPDDRQDRRDRHRPY
nr:370_t:CDS:10 [Entrophospora candida]